MREIELDAIGVTEFVAEVFTRAAIDQWKRLRNWLVFAHGGVVASLVRRWMHGPATMQLDRMPTVQFGEVWRDEDAKFRDEHVHQ